jgi:hypothetical protein
VGRFHLMAHLHRQLGPAARLSLPRSVVPDLPVSHWPPGPALQSSLAARVGSFCRWHHGPIPHPHPTAKACACGFRVYGPGACPVSLPRRGHHGYNSRRKCRAPKLAKRSQLSGLPSRELIKPQGTTFVRIWVYCVGWPSSGERRHWESEARERKEEPP